MVASQSRAGGARLLQGFHRTIHMRGNLHDGSACQRKSTTRRPPPTVTQLEAAPPPAPHSTKCALRPPSSSKISSRNAASAVRSRPTAGDHRHVGGTESTGSVPGLSAHRRLGRYQGAMKRTQRFGNLQQAKFSFCKIESFLLVAVSLTLATFGQPSRGQPKSLGVCACFFPEGTTDGCTFPGFIPAANENGRVAGIAEQVSRSVHASGVPKKAAFGAQTEKEKLVKLNLGCGSQVPDDYAIPLGKGDRRCGVLLHTLEHFTKEEGRRFLTECHRVLKKGGIIRLLLPDLRHLVTEYIEGRIRADDFVESLGVLYERRGSYIKDRLAPFFQFPHKCMYDTPRLLEILREIGFDATNKAPFESEISDIQTIELKGRTENAVIVEGKKR